MNLYTVTIDFEDRTQAIMQVEGMNQVEALHHAVKNSEALKEYDKAALEETLENFLSVIHLAMNYKGIWLWHHVNFDNKAVENIYGGIIVQTDQAAAIRQSSST